MMRIEVNEIQLAVDAVGEGTPLLLLHGFTGSRLNWEPFLPLWSRHHKLILVDLIGHGDSDHPKDPNRYSMQHAANDLAALLDRFSIEKTNLLGYSMGGRLALTFAILHPSRVRSLVLESSSPGLAQPEERQERIAKDEQLADSIERDGIEAFVDRWQRVPLFASQDRLPEEVKRTIRNRRLQNHPLGLANSLRGMGTGVQPSWWGQLESLSTPALLIVGEFDLKFRAIVERMHEKLPSSEVQVIPGAGHTVHVEQPEIFGKIVWDYFQR